ncbi:MAG: type II CAAX endopeptidase family protein [Fodinibius sp.]|nr:type II CAAX endopeptidase family protein [Fodinibius sp.]
MNIFINNNENRARSGWRLLIQFIFMFLLVGFGILGIQLLVEEQSLVYLAIPQFIGIIASVWIAARYLDKRPFSDFGCRFNQQWFKDFAAGAGIAAIAQGTIFCIEWSTGWLTISGFGWNAPTEHSFSAIMISSLLAMLMVGFHEELLSRGYQLLNITEGLRYPQIGTRGAIIIAVLITSSLFGIMHIFNANASVISTVNISLAGIILAVPYIITGSLGISVGLHFSWNFVMAAVLGFPVSGINFESSVIRIQQGGPELWTGGAFGPEAGIMGIMGMAIMLGLSYVYIKAEGTKLAIDSLFTNKYRPSSKSDEQTP